jgi:phage terminase large subunit
MRYETIDASTSKPVADGDLFAYLAKPYEPGSVAPWKPRPLTHEQWPPNYAGVFAWRLRQLHRMRADPVYLKGAKAFYAANKMQFVNHWLDTYDPRTKGGMKWKPFVFFKRQAEAWQFIEELERDQEGGLIEKCRDMGLTWLGVSYSNTKWLFEDNAAIGWGSRKEILVDKLGDPDSIFEKMRLQLRRMPKEFLPLGFNWREHATFMKMINPENGSVIAGEAGDNIGRGGRKGIYLKDESAHYERPELVEAALGDNTNVPIDISSVNGTGNVFYRKRKAGQVWYPDGDKIEAGKTRVLLIDWRDHPEENARVV